MTTPKGGLDQLLKQAQEMQAKMQAAQKKLAEMTVVGEAGGGLVKVTMNGRHDVLKVYVEPSLLKEDKEVLEDLLAAAINDAVRKVEKASREELAALTAGMQLPDGLEGSTDQQ
jgi:DNA-binding YbaB/EbfC family protein